MDAQELDDLLQQIADTGDYLDQAPNVETVEEQAVHLLLTQATYANNPLKLQVVHMLFVKNDIFGYLHTSDQHLLHQKSEERLRKANAVHVRVLIGDVRLNLEEIRDNFKQNLLTDVLEDEAWMPTAFQAAAAQGMLNSLEELREKMAMNFYDKNFMNKSLDQKIISDKPQQS